MARLIARVAALEMDLDEARANSKHHEEMAAQLSNELVKVKASNNAFLDRLASTTKSECTHDWHSNNLGYHYCPKCDSSEGPIDAEGRPA